MTLDEFLHSLTATEPPAGLRHALSGLWWDAKGDWKKAHESAQQDEGIEGSWVHAYLHRKEGDQDNAAIGTVGPVSPFVENRARCGMAQHCPNIAEVVVLREILRLGWQDWT